MYIIYKLIMLQFILAAWISVLNFRYIQSPMCYVHLDMYEALKLNSPKENAHHSPKGFSDWLHFLSKVQFQT